MSEKRSSQSRASAQSRRAGAIEDASFFTSTGTYFPSMMWPTVGPFTGLFFPFTYRQPILFFTP